MAQYPKITLTNSGLNMIAESQGGTELIFTKMNMGDGEISEGEDIKALADVKHAMLSVPLQGFLNQGKGQVRLRFAVSNERLETGFFAREIGVYAKLGESGAEQLYAYTNAGNKTDYIPDKSVPLESQIMDLYIIVGNAEQVSAVLDENVSYATKRDLEEHDADISVHTLAFRRHNTDTTAHTAGIAGNAKTATRLKPALNGSRNQCWLLCRLPKTALALVHYRILGAQYYDQYSVLEVVIKNGRSWCKYTGFSTNYQVVVRAYETENSIDVYLFAQGYDDIWEVFLEKNNAVSEFAYKKVGDATYVPAGTLVCDTATGQGMSGVELFNAKSSTGESIGHIGFTISNIPDGCLILDTGAVVSRATYPELWKFVQSNKNLLPVVTDAEWQTMAGNQTAVVAFSMGDGSTTFRLPRLLGWAKGGAQADVGNTHEAGLPNITGSISPLVFGKMYDGQKKGAFAYENNHFNMSQGTAGVSFGQQNISFNASKSNAIYGASTEVQPAGFVGVYYIRAFHGTTNEGLADVTALANEKADRDLSNISDTGKQTILSHVIASGNGYIKFADGTMIQYIPTSPNSIPGNAGKTYYFPLSFANTSYLISLSFLDCSTNRGAIYEPQVRDKARNGIYIINTNSSNCDYDIIAIGRWK